MDRVNLCGSAPGLGLEVAPPPPSSVLTGLDAHGACWCLVADSAWSRGHDSLYPSACLRALRTPLSRYALIDVSRLGQKRGKEGERGLLGRRKLTFHVQWCGQGVQP